MLTLKEKEIRFLIQLRLEDKKKLEKLAADENRSLANYIKNILLIHLKEKEEGN